MDDSGAQQDIAKAVLGGEVRTGSSISNGTGCSSSVGASSSKYESKTLHSEGGGADDSILGR